MKQKNFLPDNSGLTHAEIKSDEAATGKPPPTHAKVVAIGGGIVGSASASAFDGAPQPHRTYEPTGMPWKAGGTPWNFGHEILQPNLDRIADRLEMSFERIPAICETYRSLHTGF